MSPPRSLLTLLFLLFCLLLLPFSPIFSSISVHYFPSRFTQSAALRTATLHYSFKTTYGTADGPYVPCLENCPWEQFTPNAEFKSEVKYTEAFVVDKDKKVLEMRGQLACVPSTFGYSVEKGLQIFPEYQYPACRSKVAEEMAVLDLDTNKGQFSVKCKSNETARYVQYPAYLSPTAHMLYTSLSPKLVAQPYHSPVNTSSEFVLSACDKVYNSVKLEPKFQPEAFKRARKIMRESSEFESICPMIILFISVDSYSRRHFYRKMKSTVQMLTSLNNFGRYGVFDFKVHNIMGQGSPENMVPMFSNQTLRGFESPPKGDALGETSLWALLRAKGYVTMLGFEDCDKHFPDYLGDQLDVDHLIRSFYCGTQKYCGVNMHIVNTGQRCIGPHMSHYYALNYTQAFTRLYSGANQFIYLHLDAAHESSGQHAATLDEDLAHFLRQFLNGFGVANDVVLFVQGDHGMRYGDWERDLEAEQEHKLPVLFLSAPTRLLDILPYSYDCLWHNTFRLVSKLDLRATILGFSLLPYHQHYPVHQEAYLHHAKVLFSEKIEDSRVCEDVGITPWTCSCLPSVEEIPSDIIHSWGLGDIERLLNVIVEETVYLINQQQYTPRSLPGGLLCRRLSVGSIVQAYGAAVDKKSEQLTVTFTVREQVGVRIETIALVSSNSSSVYFRSQWKPLRAFQHLGYPVDIQVGPMQIIEVARRDAYKSLCEQVSRANGVEAEFCLCNDLTALLNTFPKLVEE